MPFEDERLWWMKLAMGVLSDLAILEGDNTRPLLEDNIRIRSSQLFRYFYRMKVLIVLLACVTWVYGDETACCFPDTFTFNSKSSFELDVTGPQGSPGGGNSTLFLQ